jgi:hypothetical protein
MSQVVINTPEPAAPSQPAASSQPAAPEPIYTSSSGATSAASNNLTWAIGLVLIIAAIAIAIVYVSHNVMH